MKLFSLFCLTTSKCLDSMFLHRKAFTYSICIFTSMELTFDSYYVVTAEAEACSTLTLIY